MSASRRCWALALLLVSGCSAKYGCKGMPDDPTCLSAVEAYRATDAAAPLPAPTVTAAAPTAADAGTSLSGTTAMPRIDDPTPIRTPSQVMRIWIAPWEDTDGDLNVSGYVYTELEPRRWIIGQPPPSPAQRLTPLQIKRRERSDSRSTHPDEGRRTDSPPGHAGDAGETAP